MKFTTGRKDTCVPSGSYKVCVADVKIMTTFKRPAFEFHFIVVEGVHADVELRGFCNADYEKFSNRTKLWKWYEKATGAEFEPDLELDLDDFKDKILIVKVETKTSKKTGNEFSNVTEIEGVERDLL